MCPSISEGVFPNCKCRYGETYDNVTYSCSNSQCPENTTIDSIYPKCKCMKKNHHYNEYLNECYLICPEDSTGYFPDCKCNDKIKGFNKGKQTGKKSRKMNEFSEKKTNFLLSSLLKFKEI